ncbi:MAG: ATP-binding protein [Verrucomicrobiota bacterium]
MKSLGLRLTFWYVLVVTITATVALLLGRWLLDRELIHGIDLLNAAEFQEIKSRIERDAHLLPEKELIQKVATHAEIDDPIYFFQIRRMNGALIFRSVNMGNAVFPENPADRVNLTLNINPLGAVRIAQFNEGGLQLQIATSLQNVNHLFDTYLQVGLVLLGVAVLLSCFFGYWLSRLALDPIRRIQRIASRISADNLSERIPIGKGEDELADLTALLNKMFDRLERSFERLWRFAADASHELKTPLSLIRLQSEKFLLHGNLPPSHQEALQQQLGSIDRLNSVIEKMLFLAKSEVGCTPLNLKRQSTAAFISEFKEDARALCEDSRVEFRVDSNDDGEVLFDAALIRQVLLNLVTNAIHVLPAGGSVTLSSSLLKNWWRVVVEDNGPGLPEDRLAEVFRPFVRLNRVADENHPAGAGLGLAICRTIIHLHHGITRAENRTPEPGLRVSFDISLSLNQEGMTAIEN